MVKMGINMSIIKTLSIITISIPKYRTLIIEKQQKLK